jgi:hypothetical protein
MKSALRRQGVRGNILVEGYEGVGDGVSLVMLIECLLQLMCVSSAVLNCYLHTQNQTVLGFLNLR